MRANPLILFVSQWSSAIEADASGGCFGEKGMHAGLSELHAAESSKENYSNQATIFRDTCVQNHGFSFCVWLTTSKDRFWHYHSDAFSLKFSRKIPHFMQTFVGHKLTFTPAACTARCPLVSSPLLSGSPAAAGCFAWVPGCSRRLSTGCLLCSWERW